MSMATLIADAQVILSAKAVIKGDLTAKQAELEAKKVEMITEIEALNISGFASTPPGFLQTGSNTAVKSGFVFDINWNGTEVTSLDVTKAEASTNYLDFDAP